jgi:hypothetical protein
MGQAKIRIKKIRKFHMKIIKSASALLMFTYISVSHAAVVHITDLSGNLLGANNVLVDGTL